MTGEMSWIDQEGNDSNGDQYPLHAAVAKALGGIIKPFDVYQGPYIVFGKDIRVGNNPYAIAPKGLGTIRLWLCGEEEYFWFREDTGIESDTFWWNDINTAIEAARELLKEGD